MTETSLKIEQVPLCEYAKFIEAVGACAELTKTATRIGILLAKGFRVDWGYCCYSIDQMAEWLGVTRQSIHTALRVLERLKFVAIDRTHCRNHYVPLFGQYQECRGSRVLDHRQDEPVRSRVVDPPDVKEIVPHNIEKSSDSLRESSSSLETIKEPIARRRGRRAGAFENLIVEEGGTLLPPPTMIRGWIEFRDHILGRCRLPSGWDRWAFEKSVMAFSNKVRRTDHQWCGLRFATARLSQWLRRERYHTRADFAYRSYKDFLFDEG